MNDPYILAGEAERLHAMILAGHPCIRIVTGEEQEMLLAARQAGLNMGRPVLEWSVLSGVKEGLLEGAKAVPQTEHPAAALYYFSTVNRPSVIITADLVPHLKDDRTLRAWRELVAHLTRRHRDHDDGSTLVMIDHATDTPAVVEQHSLLHTPALPDTPRMEDIVRRAFKRLHRQKPIAVAATQSTLDAVVRSLAGLSQRQAELILREAVADDRRFDDKDIPAILIAKRRMLGASGALEAVEAPTDLSQIGGMTNLKKWLEMRRDALSPKAAAFGVAPPKGVLLLGVQGAGKSLCAKAVATAWQVPLLRLDAGSLYDKFVGESERRLRTALDQAKAMAPVVLWIDEIEKAFASAASQSTDGGLSKRMFGTLLTWMQERTRPIFLVATANDIEALPPELLRKGRFDEIFFVDLPGEAARRDIFSIHLRKRGRDAAVFDVDALARTTAGFSGAEIEQSICSALCTAFAEGQALETRHILDALRTSPPLSVTMAEKMQALRDWARGRCVPAD
ncbi:MAG TPA: AAA family ATPase [Phycisphaerales bacterium]|nr:AAA family ATPase [Phycisphaerales bacterium]